MNFFKLFYISINKRALFNKFIVKHIIPFNKLKFPFFAKYLHSALNSVIMEGEKAVYKKSTEVIFVYKTLAGTSKGAY